MFIFILINVISFFVCVKIYTSSLNYKYSTVSYLFFCCILVLVVGFRAENVDHDYQNYFNAIYDNTTISEPTFLFFSLVIRNFSLPPAFLFLLYATLGIGLKFWAIRKYSSFQLVALLIYFSNFLLLHEITQIRAGVASGLLLLSFRVLANKCYKQFLLFVFVAALFHFSSLFALLLLPVTNTGLTQKRIVLWGLFPMLGLFLHVFNINVISMIPIDVIREKMQMYKALEEMGEDGFSQVNLFNPYYLFKLGIYYFFLTKYTFFERKDKYFTIYLKIFGLSLFLFPALSSITPLLGYRISELFGIIEIFLFPIACFLFRTHKQSLLVIFLYYSLLMSVNVYHKELIFL